MEALRAGALCGVAGLRVTYRGAPATVTGTPVHALGRRSGWHIGNALSLSQVVGLALWAEP